MKNIKLELLAPAGSQEALRAAIQSGADAVYLGGQKFNARKRADNFNNDQLIEAIKYAHLYGVKVYITFNTLVKQKELGEARDFAEFLYYSNCDAVIVQDLGVAAMIKKYFPQLNLHASTQMTIHNLEGVKMLEDMGFKRVVLARELSIDEITYIAQRTSLELETFIHGALCVCYSGQCLMSSMLGGRSGNRGLCAQPCRLPFRLEKQEFNDGIKRLNRYLLNTRDLAVYPFLSELIKAGVRSFKIEGRLKRSEYIAVTTKIYRKLLDNIYEDNMPGYTSKDEKSLLQIFNRGGFCSGYYYGFNSKELMCPEKPGNWGVYIGKVVNVRKEWIDIKLESELEIGDGITFRNDSKDYEWGQEVTKMKDIRGRELEIAVSGNVISIKREIKQKVDCSASVWKTSSKRQLEEAAGRMKQKYGRKIPIFVHAVFKKRQLPLIEIQDLKGIKGVAVGKQKVQIAQKTSLSRQTIEKQINRLGNTPFEISRMDIEMDDNIFVPLSTINELRRKAVSNLIENRIASMEMSRAKVNYKPEACYYNDIQNNSEQESIKPELYIFTEKMIEDENILQSIDGLGFVPRSWNFDFAVLRNYINDMRKKGIKTRLVLPRIMRYEDIIFLEKLDSNLWSIFDSYQAGNLGSIYFLRRKGVKTIIGDTFLNTFNSISIRELANLGVEGVILSQELQYREIEDIVAKSVIPCEIVIFGYIPLMIMEYCPVGKEKKDCEYCKLEQGYKLIDRKGMAFCLKKRGISRCYTEILNSQVLLVADEMEKITRTGVKRFALKLEGFKLEDMKEIVALHRFAIDHPKQNFSADMEKILRKLKSTGHTRGHYFRGVE